MGDWARDRREKASFRYEVLGYRECNNPQRTYTEWRRSARVGRQLALPKARVITVTANPLHEPIG